MAISKRYSFYPQEQQMFKVLIADDEYLARETIKILLKDQIDISEVFEAENGNQAFDIATKEQPDLIFLDIQMPGKSGIEIAEQLEENAVIIFATAYDQFAITAFELSAIDYLLKPFDDDRFYESLDKARAQITAKTRTNVKDISRLIHQMISEKDVIYKSRIVVKDPGRVRLIEVDDVNFILGAGNYADIYLSDGSHILHRETLTSLEQQLNPNVFVRIHRSTIVKRTCVSELEANENGDYVVILKTGERLTLSRRNKNKLEELIRTD